MDCGVKTIRDVPVAIYSKVHGCPLEIQEGQASRAQDLQMRAVL